MNEQDKELVNKHSGRVGDVIFTASGLNEFLAARDAIKHKELLAIHEVLQCIGCEHEASEDDTWTVKGVKQLAERVRKAEAANNSQANSVPEGTLQDLEDSDYVAKRFRLILTKLGISTPESDEELLLGAFSYLGMARRVLDDIFATPQSQSIEADKVRELEWLPIETAPKDNKRPLFIARFNDDGTMQSFDYDAIWKEERESWEMPQVYYYWASANGNVEEPSHWCYEPEGFSKLSEQAIQATKEANR